MTCGVRPHQSGSQIFSVSKSILSWLDLCLHTALTALALFLAVRVILWRFAPSEGDQWVLFLKALGDLCCTALLFNLCFSRCCGTLVRMACCIWYTHDLQIGQVLYGRSTTWGDAKYCNCRCDGTVWESMIACICTTCTDVLSVSLNSIQLSTVTADWIDRQSFSWPVAASRGVDCSADAGLRCDLLIAAIFSEVWRRTGIRDQELEWVGVALCLKLRFKLLAQSLDTLCTLRDTWKSPLIIV